MGRVDQAGLVKKAMDIRRYEKRRKGRLTGTDCEFMTKKRTNITSNEIDGTWGRYLYYNINIHKQEHRKSSTYRGKELRALGKDNKQNYINCLTNHQEAR